MKNLYYIFLFLISNIIVYYFAIGDFRTAVINILNLILTNFLISKSSHSKSIIYYIIILVVLAEYILFSYSIISGFDIRILKNIFNEDFVLSPEVYELKGFQIFSLDKNMIAPIFGISAIVFKQFRKNFFSFISFLILILTFSRSAIFLTFLFLLYPAEKLKLRYIFLPISFLMFLLLNYEGSNSSLIFKKGTYTLFFDLLPTIGPLNLIFGNSNLYDNELIQNLGYLIQGHTLAGSIVSFGLIYLFSSIVIFIILWSKYIFLRLPILFLIAYSLFSLTAFNVSIPLLVLVSTFQEKYSSLNYSDNSER